MVTILGTIFIIMGDIEVMSVFSCVAPGHFSSRSRPRALTYAFAGNTT
jgi:hypothetical protein